jgi:hypothetical protein
MRHVAGILLLLGILFLVLGSISNIASAQGRGRGQLMTIPVRVNGEVGMFLIDTGSARSAVDREFAQRLGLRTTGSARIRRNYSVEDVPTVAVERFQFANRVFADVSLLDTDLQPASQTMAITLGGLLGTDFLSNAYVKLRYSSGTAVVPGPEHAAIPINMKKVEGVFFVPVRVGASIVDMLLDTGANLTAVSYGSWSQLPSFRTQGVLVEGIRSAGIVQESALGCASMIGLGETVLHNQASRIVGKTQAGNFDDNTFVGVLGADTLEHFDLTLDCAHSRIYLKPDLTYQADPYVFVTIGIQFFKAQTGAFGVAAVWRPSPAHESGIVIGDQIVSINSQKSTDLDLNFSGLLHQPPGTPLTLEIARPEGIVVIHCRTRRLACVSD